MLLHEDRYYPTTTWIKNGVVIHDSESGDGSSATLVSILKSPGNIPSKHGGMYGPGYHAITDGKGGYVQLANSSAGTYSAGSPANTTFWHVCIPGFAKQTREEWQDELSMAHIKGVAKFVYEKWIEDGKSWGLSFVFADQLVKGIKGYTSHYQVSLAWHNSDHYDPGPNFPWDVLEQEIGKLIQTPEEDDVADVYYRNAEARTWNGTAYPAGNVKYFLQPNGVPRRISGEELADRGHPKVDINFGIPKSNAYLDSVGAPQ
jgi:hypothetical protein